MQDDFDQSLDAHSEFVPFYENLDKSLVATSQKVVLANASIINKQELQKARLELKQVAEESLEDTQNQFLEVGKWRKGKESVQSKQMASVKQEIQHIMTKTRWKESEKPIQKEEEIIADESICPEEQAENEQAIEDQTQQEQEQQNGEQDEEQEQQEDEQEQEQEEQEQEQEQQEEQQQEQQEQSQEEEQQEEQNEDDRTDAQSQMKQTDYEPSKWSKKRQSIASSRPQDEVWQRKQKILQRILQLVK